MRSADWRKLAKMVARASTTAYGEMPLVNAMTLAMLIDAEAASHEAIEQARAQYCRNALAAAMKPAPPGTPPAPPDSDPDLDE